MEKPKTVTEQDLRIAAKQIFGYDAVVSVGKQFYNKGKKLIINFVDELKGDDEEFVDTIIDIPGKDIETIGKKLGLMYYRMRVMYEAAMKREAENVSKREQGGTLPREGQGENDSDTQDPQPSSETAQGNNGE